METFEQFTSIKQSGENTSPNYYKKNIKQTVHLHFQKSKTTLIFTAGLGNLSTFRKTTLEVSFNL